MKTLAEVQIPFSDLQINEKFYFASKDIKKQVKSDVLYTKVEEHRRAYTPEAFCNVMKVDKMYGETYLYSDPTTKVVRRDDVNEMFQKMLMIP